MHISKPYASRYWKKYEYCRGTVHFGGLVLYSKMGTFADTANVDYHISFANKDNKLSFFVSVSSVFRIYMYIEMAAYIYI
jgi:hypothetical protein